MGTGQTDEAQEQPRLRVAGEDRRQDLLRDLLAETSGRPADPFAEILEREADVLQLREAPDPEAFTERFLGLLRARNRVDLARRNALVGAKRRGCKAFFKSLAWRLLCHQHVGPVEAQNAINIHLTSLLEFERSDLLRRIERLEQRLASAEPTAPSRTEADTSTSAAPPGARPTPTPLRRIDQFVAGLAEGDAISHDAMGFRDALHALGIESDIYVPAARIGPSMGKECRPLNAFDGTEKDAVILHYSTGSNVTDAFMAFSGRGILRYHNITPPGFFDPYDDTLAAELRRGRDALPAVAARCDAIWADSTFNARDFDETAGSKVDVVPLLVSHDRAAPDPDPATASALSRDLKTIVFVGRLAPNKCLEELLLAFGWLTMEDAPGLRLVLAGSDRSCPRYAAFLRLLADRLELRNIAFMGFLNAAQLEACYRAADLFVCTSRHEGYCLPLVEAMQHEVPVLARDCGGMPEATGGGSILFENLEPRVLARLMHRALFDTRLRQTVISAQSAVVRDLQKRDCVETCRSLLAGLDGGH